MRPDGVIRQRFRGRGKRISGHGFYTGHGSYTGHTPHLTICSPLRSTRHAGDRERSKGGFNRELGVLPVISAHVRAPASTSPPRTARRVHLSRETALHNSEIRKVTPGFMGTLLFYES